MLIKIYSWFNPKKRSLILSQKQSALAVTLLLALEPWPLWVSIRQTPGIAAWQRILVVFLSDLMKLRMIEISQNFSNCFAHITGARSPTNVWRLRRTTLGIEHFFDRGKHCIVRIFVA
jgi:hypothetical protein